MKQNKLTNNHRKSNPWALKFELVVACKDIKAKKMLYGCLMINRDRIEEAMYKEADLIMADIKKQKDAFILNPKMPKEQQIKASLRVPKKKDSLLSKVVNLVKRENEL